MFLFATLIYIVFCLLVASVGSGKRIGGAGAFFLSLILSPIIGLLFVIASAPKETKAKPQHISEQKHRFEEYMEAGKRSEFKEKYEDALDQYQDALYYLENDYTVAKRRSMSKKDISVIDRNIEHMKRKIAEMKEKLSTNGQSQTATA